MPTQRKPPPVSESRPPLRAAIAIGVVGVLWMTVPRIDASLRAQFAERLAARAEASTGGEVRLTVRRLADSGAEALGALVRLGGSANSEAAGAAQDAVGAQLAAWEIDFRTGRDERALAHRLQELGAALAAAAADPKFAAMGRAWTHRTALRIVALCDSLSAESSLVVLAHCDSVLSTAKSTVASPPAPPRRDTIVPVPVAAAPKPTAASELAELLRSAAPPKPSADGDLQVVGESTPPAIAPARVDPAAAAPLATATRREASGLLELRKPQPLSPPAPTESVVDVPSPLEARRLLRRYRQMSDRELTTRLVAASGYDALAIQQVLRERKLPASAVRPAPTSGAQRLDAERLLFERVGKLPAAAARKLLRQLVADETEAADIRLEALTLLATSGDPQLAEIARRRALEDADPRVADLATQILRDARK